MISRKAPPGPDSPTRMILKRDWMLLDLMAARHAETTCVLACPTRSRAAFWIIFEVSLQRRSCSAMPMAACGNSGASSRVNFSLVGDFRSPPPP